MLIEGQKYRIVKPIDLDESPTWASGGMDRYIGTIITYNKSMDIYGYDWITYGKWDFNNKWLYPIDDKLILTFVLSLIK